MRIALLSDIHGNSVAFDAVLDDVRSCGGVDAFWVLGDIVALGPDPLGVIERLEALKNVQCIRGNTDRYVALGDRPAPSVSDVMAQPSLLPQFIEVAQTFTWTQGAVTAAGRLQWLRELPLELRFTLPDGSRFLGVHASPGRDDGDGISETMSDKALEEMLECAGADIICAGHTHRPLDRHLAGRRLINLGAVSLSATGDKRSSYAILTADAGGYQVEQRKVAFDIGRVVAMLQKVEHPGRAFILRHLSD